MKKFALFSTLFILILTGTASSQSIPSEYKKMDYIRVSPDQFSSFIEQAADKLTPVYQQLAADGNIISWRLYHVSYPGNSMDDYNFVSVVTASSMEVFENIFSSVSSSPYVPSASVSEIDRIHDSVEKTELWRVRNSIIDSSNNHPTNYMTMDYMKVAPDKNPDYLMLEDEVAKPIHNARIEKGIMSGWEVYSLIAPGGVEYGYNFATGNFYNKLEHVEYGFTKEVINQAMGTNTNIPELFDTIYKTRDMIKVELWELVAHSK